MSLFQELKRRSVFRVGVAYIVVAWLILQVTDVILGNITAPAWVFLVILLLLTTGFPLILLFAWAYELTPDGIKRESDLAGPESNARPTNRLTNYVIIGALAMAVIYSIVVRDTSDHGSKTTIENLIARPSVLVLPFVNSNGDSNHDYLAFGITDELITGLQRYKEFPVASRYASMEYSTSGLSASEFANNLGVSYRVEGSISSVYEGIRVLASLSFADGRQVWAERFQRQADEADLFDIADETDSGVNI